MKFALQWAAAMVLGFLTLGIIIVIWPDFQVFAWWKVVFCFVMGAGWQILVDWATHE